MSSFQFDFFDGPQAAQHQDNNLQQILQKMDHSIDFDQFDPVDNDPAQKSKGSDFFSKKSSKKQSNRMESAKSKEDSHEFQFENSRNINEISIAQNLRNQSFRFQSKEQNNQNYLDTNDHRYQKLQALFNRAKTNNLDNFYRNLDQQNTYRVQQKFRSKEEFKDYRNKLKIYKKSLEEDFLHKKGNYNFKYNQYSQPTNQKNGSAQNHHSQSNNFFQYSQPSAPHNFKKKQSNKYQSNPKKSNSNQPIDFFNFQQPNIGHTNNFLPQNLHQAQDQVDFYELKPEDINKQIELYQQKQYQKQAENFFVNNQFKKSKQQKSMKKLQTINQERPNMFEITQEQEKMKKLIVNYQEIKTNFNSLMQNLKETNNDQQQIINQFKEFKKEYQIKQSRLKYQQENKREKMIVKEREKQQKNRKINEIKQEIHKIKDNGQKDILILKLNEKVQNLEEILKNAIMQLNQQKQQKLIPKIINYYNQPQVKHTSRSKSQRSNHIEFSNNQNDREESREQDSGIDRLNDQYLRPVRNAIKDLRDDRQQEGNFIDEFSSPLQLDLTTQEYPLNLSRGRSQQLQPAFSPPQNGKEYYPNLLDTNNKFLRRCLTQKSSILFESFEFYITGKFTITGNERYPVTCQVRVANKCAINLYDIFVIVYGPHAQESELQMRPSKILYDEFKYNTSFIFQVDLAKQILQCGNFSIQISYKTDTATKKKVNFKCVLPFTQLIKPEFIYQQQFINAWNHMGVEFYTKPKQLDFRNIRSHEDLKLILPFIEVNQPDPNSFSYGIMFNYPKSLTVFMVKVTCYVSGKASLHLKSGDNNNNSDKKLRQQIMDILSYLIFG